MEQKRLWTKELKRMMLDHYNVEIPEHTKNLVLSMETPKPRLLPQNNGIFCCWLTFIEFWADNCDIFARHSGHYIKCLNFTANSQHPIIILLTNIDEIFSALYSGTCEPLPKRVPYFEANALHLQESFFSKKQKILNLSIDHVWNEIGYSRHFARCPSWFANYHSCLGKSQIEY